MHCIVGLGNPGPEYAQTRHNVGFRALDLLAHKHGIGLTRHRLRSIFGRGRIAQSDCLLVKPQTFMNDSGDAVARVALYYKLEPEDIFLVYDDIALDLGATRIRRGGSHGGHKGVRSVIAYLGTQEFPRLRLGIGQPPEGQSNIDYVLSTFSKEQSEAADQLLERAVAALEEYLGNGIEAAMNLYNT